LSRRAGQDTAGRERLRCSSPERCRQLCRNDYLVGSHHYAWRATSGSWRAWSTASALCDLPLDESANACVFRRGARLDMTRAAANISTRSDYVRVLAGKPRWRRAAIRRVASWDCEVWRIVPRRHLHQIEAWPDSWSFGWPWPPGHATNTAASRRENPMYNSC